MERNHSLVVAGPLIPFAEPQEKNISPELVNAFVTPCARVGKLITGFPVVSLQPDWKPSAEYLQSLVIGKYAWLLRSAESYREPSCGVPEEEMEAFSRFLDRLWGISGR